MSATSPTRLLLPAVLAQISSLDLVAKTVVQGFVAGLHRSPDFGFSQEFAEYRAYSPGDDLRHVDWNVFARTDRAFLKRYRGETNTQILVLLDASASMGYGSATVTKLSYAKFLAAVIVYLSQLQRDSAGLVTFHDHVEKFIPPSTRQGQLMRLLHGIDETQLGRRTNYQQPFDELQHFLKRKGISILISDFFEDPATIIKTIEPLRYRGHELVLFHILDTEELEPQFREPLLLLDMETQEAIEATPDYAQREYREKLTSHIESMRSKCRGAGIDYFLLRTDQPLDAGLREYFMVRQRRM